MAHIGPDQIYVPTAAQAAHVPADMALMAESLQDHIVGIAADEADRDARYNEHPPGVIVTCPPRSSIWIRTATGWATIWEAPQAEDIAATPASGWEINRLLGIRPCPGDIEIRGSILRTGGPLTAGVTGNGPDTQVLQLPGGWRPSGGIVVRCFFGASATSGQAVISPTSGNMAILDWHPGSTIDTDHFLTFSVRYSGRL